MFCLCHTEVDRIDAGVLLQSWTFCTFGSRRSSVENGAVKFLARASGGWGASNHLTERWRTSYIASEKSGRSF